MSALRQVTRRKSKALARSVAAVLEQMESRRMLCDVPGDNSLLEIVVWDGDNVTTTNVLDDDVTYRLEAIGVVTYTYEGSSSHFDAEYRQVGTGEPDGKDLHDIGLRVGGQNPTFHGDPMGGPYYTNFSPTSDAQVTFSYNFGGNSIPTGTISGGIYIAIYADPHEHPNNALPVDNGLGSQNQNAMGGMDKYSIRSVDGIRLTDGQFSLTEEELSTAGFGLSWGQTRVWTNTSWMPSAIDNGEGWFVSQLPFVRKWVGDAYAVVLGPDEIRWFDYSGGVYTPRNFDKSKLIASGDDLLYIDTNGNRILFDDFCHDQINRRGMFKSFTDPYGNSAFVPQGGGSDSGYDGEHRIRWVDRYDGSNAERYEYSYNGDDKLSSVSLKQADNYNSSSPGSATWTTIRTVEYSYYGSSDSNGRLGDLKFAIVKVGSTEIDRRYYRYYTSDSGDGYAGGLKMTFDPESYVRALASVGGSVSSLESASDSAIDQFATHQLKYSDHRVDEHVVQGAAGAGQDGLGTYTFSTYENSNDPIDLNGWSRQVVVTNPNGTTTTSYLNALGQPIVEYLSSGSSKWATAYHYDNEGRLVWRAQPSAVSFGSGDVSIIDDGSTDIYVSNSTGLIEVYDYYGDGSDHTATAASEGTAGAVSGYLEDTYVKSGLTGTAQRIDRKEYKSSPSSVTVNPIYPVGKVIRYRGSGGTGAEEMQFAYTWHQASGANTAAIKQRTTTPPTISSGKNGSATSTDYDYIDELDVWGRVVWHRDQADNLSNYQYDTVTGVLTTFIEDVDTDTLAAPNSWTSSDGIHSSTSYVVDALGRNVAVTAPNGNVTRIVYLDTQHEVRVYEGWHSESSVFKTTGPISVIRRGLDGASDSIFYETLTMTATPGESGGAPTGGESISGIVSLSRSITNEAGQITNDEDYYNLSGVTYDGSDLTLVTTLNEPNHLYRKTYAYDSTGQVNRYVGPTGTIYRTVRDDLGRTISNWVGLDDTPTSGEWSPSNTTNTDLVKTHEYEYDFGGVGNSNLTTVIADPGAEGDRWTEYFYDWRNRLTAVKLGGTDTPEEELEKVQRQVTYYTRDNLGQVTQVDTYDGDTVEISYTSGVPNAPASNRIRSRATMAYDELGRVYQTSVYSVTYVVESDGDPDTATVGSSSDTLDTNYWYDSRGNLMKVSRPGGLVTKSTYDGLNRLSIQYASDGGSDSGYTDADDVTGDKVLEQVEYTFDESGNVLMILSRQRFHDETDTGALEEESGSSTVKSRVSYHAFYYDKADRLIADVDVGTNAGSSYTRPGSVPSQSDTALVVDYSYVDLSTSKDVGWLMSVTSPRDIETRYSYDALGRMTQVIEGYTDGTPSASDDRKTAYVYDGNGNVTLQTAHLPSSAYQETRYIYEARISSGSELNSNDLLSAVRYAESGGGASTTGGGTHEETFANNNFGEVIEYTDRNNTTHEYEYDVLGRMGSDWATTLGSGVDDIVNRLTFAFDSAGRINTYNSRDTSIGSGDENIVNQVKFEYNGFSQLTKDSQEHGGAVISGSAVVEYVYDQTPSGANYSRLKQMIYPDGYKVHYTYGSGLDTSISRMTSVAMNNAGSPGTNYEAYSYLGLSTAVELDRPDAKTRLTYLAQGAEGNGDAGDKYAGLDRFGRIVDQRWRETDGTHSDIDRFKYGYDRDGNALYRTQELNHNYDILYKANDTLVGSNDSYDKLGRMTAFSRGTVTIGTLSQSTNTRSQSWSYDALGNWSSVTTDTNGTTSGGSSTENRTHNERNQVTNTNYAHDNNGNTTSYPNGANTATLTYDAWNRLVYMDPGGISLPEAQYQYDGLGRRVLAIGIPFFGDLSYNHRYYSKDWQLILEQTLDEEQLSSLIGGSGEDSFALNWEGLDPENEVDLALIQAMQADPTFGPLLMEFEQSESGELGELEPQFEMLGAVEDGNPQGFATADFRDRMVYIWSQVYIDAMIAREADRNNDGDYTDPYEVDIRNYTNWDANFNVTSLSVVGDYDYDGSFEAYPMAQRMTYDPYGNVQFVDLSTWSITGTNNYLWSFLHQGGKREGTNVYTFRNRDYHASQGRFIQQDPLGYVDGANLYQAYGSSPVNYVDPMGLSWGGHHVNPRGVWRGQGFSPEVEKIFNDSLVDHGDSHTYRRAHIEYSRRVKEMLRTELGGRDPNTMTSEEAEGFVRKIKKSKDRFIKGYLKVVGDGDAAVLDWWERKGKKMPGVQDPDVVAKNKGRNIAKSSAKGKRLISAIGALGTLAAASDAQAAQDFAKAAKAYETAVRTNHKINEMSIDLASKWAMWIGTGPDTAIVLKRLQDAPFEVETDPFFLRRRKGGPLMSVEGSEGRFE